MSDQQEAEQIPKISLDRSTTANARSKERDKNEKKEEENKCRRKATGAREVKDERPEEKGDGAVPAVVWTPEEAIINGLLDEVGVRGGPPLIPLDISHQLLRIQSKYFDNHPYLCTSRFRHALHHLSTERYKELDQLCHQLHDLVIKSPNEDGATMTEEKRDFYHQFLPAVFGEARDGSEAREAKEASASAAAAAEKDGDGCNEHHQRFPDDFPAAEALSSRALCSNLRKIFARLVSDYRAIFAIDGQRNGSSCGPAGHDARHDWESVEHRKRHEEEDNCPEEIKSMKVACEELTLECSASTSSSSDSGENCCKDKQCEKEAIVHRYYSSVLRGYLRKGNHQHHHHQIREDPNRHHRRYHPHQQQHHHHHHHHNQEAHKSLREEQPEGNEEQQKPCVLQDQQGPSRCNPERWTPGIASSSLPLATDIPNNRAATGKQRKRKERRDSLSEEQEKKLIRSSGLDGNGDCLTTPSSLSPSSSSGDWKKFDDLAENIAAVGDNCDGDGVDLAETHDWNCHVLQEKKVIDPCQNRACLHHTKSQGNEDMSIDGFGVIRDDGGGSLDSSLSSSPGSPPPSSCRSTRHIIKPRKQRKERSDSFKENNSSSSATPPAMMTTTTPVPSRPATTTALLSKVLGNKFDDSTHLQQPDCVCSSKPICIPGTPAEMAGFPDDGGVNECSCPAAAESSSPSCLLQRSPGSCTTSVTDVSSTYFSGDDDEEDGCIDSNRPSPDKAEDGLLNNDGEVVGGCPPVQWMVERQFSRSSNNVVNTRMRHWSSTSWGSVSTSSSFEPPESAIPLPLDPPVSWVPPMNFGVSMTTESDADLSAEDMYGTRHLGLINSQRYLDPSHMSRSTPEQDSPKRTKLKQLTRQLNTVRRKLEERQQELEESQGYRLSQSEKHKSRSMRKLLSEQTKLKRQIRICKESDFGDIDDDTTTIMTSQLLQEEMPLECPEARGDKKKSSHPGGVPTTEERSVVSTGLDSSPKSSSSSSNVSPPNDDTDDCGLSSVGEGVRINNSSKVDLEAMRSKLKSLQKKLEAQRKTVDRPMDLDYMTLEQLMQEKIDMQKALLQFERAFGHPDMQQEKLLVKEIYERYRKVKHQLRRSCLERSKELLDLETIPEDLELPLTLASPQHRINIEIGTSEGKLGDDKIIRHQDHHSNRRTMDIPSFDGSVDQAEPILHSMSKWQLFQAQGRIREEKKLYRRAIKEKEERILKETGRKRRLPRGERMDDSVYGRYKMLKAKLKLIEALLYKPGGSSSL